MALVVTKKGRDSQNGWRGFLNPFAAVVLLSLCVMSGCAGGLRAPNAREKGALAGGALGAGLGAIVGNQVGNPGAGVAIGTAFGALSGGVIGHEIQRGNEEMAERDDRISRNEEMLAENRRLLEGLRAGGLDVRETERGIVANLPDVLFQFGRSDLTIGARDAVAQIARVADRAPGRRISIEGHTDSVGSPDFNYRLSQQRARSVADELVASGIAGSRVRTRGFGEDRPISSNDSDDGRRRNRRVEVIIENR